MLNRVDLPQPLGPMTATNSPLATSSETESTAATGPSAVAKDFDTRSIVKARGADAASVGEGAAAVDSAIPRFDLRRQLVRAGATHRLPLRGTADDGARRRRGVAGQHAHVDQAGPAGVDRGDCLGEGGGERLRCGDRADAD